MKKVRVFVAAIVAACGLMGYVGYEKYSRVSENDLLLANVEALTQGEFKTTYSSMHLPCYDVIMVNGELTTIENGKHSATCWENPNSSSTTCHSHSCSYCSSE